MTPTEANRIAKWLQVLLIIVQALGTVMKTIPKGLAMVGRFARRR